MLYREPLPRGQFIILVVFSIFVWMAACSVLLYQPLDAFFIKEVFFWVPDSFFLTEDFSRYSGHALALTWVVGLVFNGIAGPIVEEMYFRGYLLPRISRLGAWTRWSTWCSFCPGRTRALYLGCCRWSTPHGGSGISI